MSNSTNAQYLNTFLTPQHPLLVPEEVNLIETMSSCVILHASLQKAQKVIRQAIAENAYFSEPRHVIILGDSGCGKTTLLDLIEQGQPPKAVGYQLGISLQQSAVILSLGSTITPRSLAIQMLRALGDQSLLNGTCQELTERLIRYIRQCNVKVIFIDEFQHLLELGRGTEQGANQRLLAARNWIKSVINKTHATFVLMGMPDTLYLVDQEDQMERRFTHLLQLTPFDQPSSSDTQMVEFADQLLDTAVNVLGLFTGAEKFAPKPDDALRLYAATQGVPGTIKDLVIRAGLCAYRRQSKTITMQDFTDAFVESRQARLEAEAARIRREKRINFAKAIEGRVLNPFTVEIDVIRPIVMQMAA